MKLTISSLKQNISISGILVIILSVIIAAFGVKDYQSKESAIDTKYNALFSISVQGITADKASIRVDEMAAQLADDADSKKISMSKVVAEGAAISNKIKSERNKLAQQRKEELDNRIFDLVTYISFAISIFIFGISLFWRKRDVNDSREFQQKILNQLSVQNLNIETLHNMQNEQSKNLKRLQNLKPLNPSDLKKGKKKKRSRS